jgi:hypothetical protein
MSVFHRLLGKSGDQVEAGLQTYNTGASLHTLDKPLPFGALGHYRQIVRFTMAISQNANSRLWEVRNPSVLGQNEGLELENVAAGSATANSVDVAVDFSWAEVTAF